MVAGIFSPVFIKRYMYVAIEKPFESRVTFETMEIVCLQTLFPSAIIAVSYTHLTLPTIYSV